MRLVDSTKGLNDMSDEYYAGKGCRCGAWSSSECACDVDWTDPKIYELEQQLTTLQSKLDEAERIIQKVKDKPKSGEVHRLAIQYLGESE